MRTISEIIIHCSATVEGKDFSVKGIDRLHKQRGVKMVGYHFVIRLDGTIEQDRPLEMVGARCTGHNAHSSGICYIGGLDKSGKPKDIRTQAQKDALWSLVKILQKKYSYKKYSSATEPAIVVEPTLHGHNELANKACPCFKVPDQL